MQLGVFGFSCQSYQTLLRYYPILLDSGMRCQITTRRYCREQVAWPLSQESSSIELFSINVGLYRFRGRIVVGKHLRYKKHVFFLFATVLAVKIFAFIYSFTVPICM